MLPLWGAGEHTVKQLLFLIGNNKYEGKKSVKAIEQNNPGFRRKGRKPHKTAFKKMQDKKLECELSLTIV